MDNAARHARRWAALAAGAVALLTRLPFAARRLWDHDSIQFALGVERYDLAAHHPHPPGYPLYIGLLKLLAALGVDPLHGMVGMAILAAGLGAAFLVLLVPELIEEAGVAADDPGLVPGLFAAALFIFNPLLWFYGELPLLYAVEGGLTVVVAWAAWRMAESRGHFLGACALFALVGGLRQSTMVLLAPLFLYGVWRTFRRGRLTWGLFLGGAVLGGALVLAWFVPLCLLAGGYGAYRRISAEHFATLLPQTSILYGAGWGALEHNLTVLAKWAIQGVLPGVAALAVLFAIAPSSIRAGLRLLRARAPFLAAWALPPMLFFALFHLTKAGYTLVHLPALLVVLALLASPGLAVPEGRARVARIAAFLVAIGLGAGLFLFGADREPTQSRLWFPLRHEWNRGSIATYERELDETIATVRQYPPESTVLVAVELSGTGSAGAQGFLYSWHRHLQWYLPEYLVVQAVPEEDFALVARGHEPFQKELSQVTLPATTERLLFVLSGPTGDRLPLGLGAVGTHGKNFYLTTVPFGGRRQLGPLVFISPPKPARRKAA
ncbi:MAG TPA: DUF2723 domain-containing protein [Thermoanaerobaculia bacterium]|nr:DUF2723 domain-containing protein [Thermoanaerobaculia bacterium]